MILLACRARSLGPNVVQIACFHGVTVEEQPSGGPGLLFESRRGRAST